MIIVAAYFSTIKKAERAYATNIKLQQAITYTFTEHEIHSAGYNFQSTYRWDEIFKVVISKNFVLIYVSAANVIIIPIRFLPKEQVELIAQHKK